MSTEDDFEIADGFAEHHERYGVGFGDNVRIRTTPETERLGYAGRTGQVFGETAPSDRYIDKGDDLVGEPETDFALSVYFEDSEQQVWFAPQLVELIDHGPGSELEIEGVRMVRDEHGAWHETGRAGSLRRLLGRLRS